MPKRLTTIRRSPETDRQVAQLCADMGETAAEVQSRAVAELWQRRHESFHYELRMSGRLIPGDATVCPWCGYIAPPEEDSE
jgi:hypothetical protein